MGSAAPDSEFGGADREIFEQNRFCLADQTSASQEVSLLNRSPIVVRLRFEVTLVDLASTWP